MEEKCQLGLQNGCSFGRASRILPYALRTTVLGEAAMESDALSVYA
jgi:hypothetical protein